MAIKGEIKAAAEKAAEMFKAQIPGMAQEIFKAAKARPGKGLRAPWVFIGTLSKPGSVTSFGCPGIRIIAYSRNPKDPILFFAVCQNIGHAVLLKVEDNKVTISNEAGALCVF